MLPSKLKNFDTFHNGNSWVGLASEIALPKITIKSEAYRGAGMLSELDINLGLEKLEMEITLGGLAREALRQMGAVDVGGAMLRFNGAYQEDVAGAVTAAELIVRGLHTEIDPGNAKAGGDTEWKLKSTLSYLKWSFNGSVDVEIDILNNVFVAGGIDRMAGIRAALDGSASLGINPFGFLGL